MPRNLFGKTLSLSSGSLIPSSRIMVFSSISKPLEDTVVNRLKKRLDDAKGKWVEELSHVLWTYRTTPRRSTRETPFLMTFGVEIVIPLETGFPTLRTSLFNPSSNNELLEKSLDLIEEGRESAMVQLAYY